MISLLYNKLENINKVFWVLWAILANDSFQWEKSWEPQIVAKLVVGNLGTCYLELISKEGAVILDLACEGLWGLSKCQNKIELEDTHLVLHRMFSVVVSMVVV